MAFDVAYDMKRDFVSCRVVDNLVFCSGYGGTDWKAGKALKGVEAQAEMAFSKLSLALEAAGTSTKNIVQMYVFMKDAKFRKAIHQVLNKYIPEPRPPQFHPVTPAMGLTFEVVCIAVRPKGAPAPKPVAKSPPSPPNAEYEERGE